ncbi:MAG: hypothetical protein HYZ53_15725 [Planctomycetes bacterium]|nr:hypothetical protein [Planctomycetota bacterium]
MKRRRSERAVCDPASRSTRRAARRFRGCVAAALVAVALGLGAGRPLAQEPSPSPAMPTGDSAPLDDPAIARLLAGTDRSGKLEAAAALARQGSLDAVQRLFALAADEDPAIREGLLSAIATCAGKDARVPGWLAGEAVRFPDPSVCALAAESLGRLPATGERAAPECERALRELLERDAEPRVLVAALAAYSRVGSFAGVQPLFDRLLRGGRPLAVRVAAVQCLLDAPEAARAGLSLAAASDDPDPSLRGLVHSWRAHRWGRRAGAPSSPGQPGPPGPPAEPRRSPAECSQAALRWLAAHQERDGRWSCSGNNPFHNDLRVPGFADEDEIADTSTTALALLAFFSAATAPGEARAFDEAVARGLSWLRARQGADGVFRDPSAEATGPAGTVHGSRRGSVNDYNHCLATLAAVEAAGRAQGAEWRIVAQRALDALLAAPRAEGFSWTRYFSPSDVGFSVFALLALVEAKGAGLAVPPEALRDARAYVDAISEPESGRVRYRVGHPQCLAGLDGTAALLVARLALGCPPEDPRNGKAAAFLAGQPPRWGAWFDLPPSDPGGGHAGRLPEDNIANFFFWRFAALAADGMAGPGAPGPLAGWRASLESLLEEHQRQGGDEEGSWDAVGVWARVGGRVYTTTMGVLALAPRGRLDGGGRGK